MRLFDRLRQRIMPAEPEPALYAVMPLEGAGIGLDFWVRALHDSGVNTVVPALGDVVIRLTTDGMGASIIRDERFRVAGRVDYPGSESPPSVKLVDRTGREELENVGMLRTTPYAKRTWIVVQ